MSSPTYSRKVLFVFTCVFLAAVIGILLIKNGRPSERVRKSDNPELAARKDPTKYEIPELTQLKKVDNRRQSADETVASKRADKSAPVMGQEPEKRLLQKAHIKHTFETPRDSKGKYTVFQEGRTGLKYPNVVFQEDYRRDAAGKDVLEKRVAMAADNVIVKAREGAPPIEIERLSRKYGGKILKRIGSGDAYLIKIEQPGINALQAAIKRFQAEAQTVAYAEPNFIVSARLTPNDPMFNEMWGLHNTAQTEGTEDADIDAPEAWDMRTTGSVVVGVIDSGIDYLHPDLQANMWRNPRETPGNGKDDDLNGYVDDVYGWDFLNDDSDPMDDMLHGTHCAGTIGAVGNNGEGITGVAWGIKIAALKFLSDEGWGYTSDAVDAVAYANRMKFKITSNSWGGGGYTQALLDEIKNAAKSGALFISAAGNWGTETDLFTEYPGGYESENIINVAATDHFDELTYFTNYGKRTVDIAAPGENILSTFPRTQTPLMIEYGFPAMYGHLDGTSMAAPHVSAAAALVFSENNKLTWRDVKRILMSTSDIKNEGSEYMPSPSDGVASGGRLNLSGALRQARSPLQIANYVIGDPVAGGGNGDGIINPGENIYLRFSVMNKSKIKFRGVTATLSLKEPDSNIVITRSSINIGDILPGDAKPSQRPFNFTVAGEATKNKRLNFVISLNSSNAASQQEELKLWVYEFKQLQGVLSLDGQPTANGLVEFRGATEGQVQSDSAGRYSFTVLPGNYLVSAPHSGGGRITKWIVVSAAESLPDINFAFYTAVSGTVKDAKSNAPIEGAKLTLGKVEGPIVTTDSAGRYEIVAGVIPGETYHMRAAKPGEYLSEAKGFVFEGSTKTVDLSMDKGSFVTTFIPDEPEIPVMYSNAANEKLDWTGAGQSDGYCYPCSYPVVSIGGKVTKIPVPDLDTYHGSGSAINNRGDVIGMLFPKDDPDDELPYRAFKYADGVVTFLEPLPGFRYAGPTFIDDSGVVIGTSNYSGDYDNRSVATRWDAQGVPSELVHLQGQGSWASIGNNRGDIYVGNEDYSRDPERAIFRYLAGTLKMVPQPKDICDYDFEPFWELTAEDVNESGTAIIKGYCLGDYLSYFYNGAGLVPVDIATQFFTHLSSLNEKGQAVGSTSLDIFGGTNENIFVENGKVYYAMGSGAVVDGTEIQIGGLYKINNQGLMLGAARDPVTQRWRMAVIKNSNAGPVEPPQDPVPSRISAFIKTSNERNVNLDILQLLGEGDWYGTVIQILSAPANGTLVQVAPGVWRYRARAGFAGEDWIIVSVTKPNGEVLHLHVPIVVVNFARYRAIEITDPENLHDLTSFQVNLSGDVIGQADRRDGGPTTGFIYFRDTGAFTLVPEASGTPTEFSIAFNDNLVITGTSGTRAFTITDGLIEYFAIFGGTHYPRAINNSELVAGDASNQFGTTTQGFVSSPGMDYPPHGRIPRYGTQLWLGQDATHVKVNALNNFWYMGGSAGSTPESVEAFIYDGGDILYLGKMGGTSSVVTGLNDTLIAVGNYMTAATPSAPAKSIPFAWRNGDASDLLENMEFLQAEVLAVNNHEASVGSMTTAAKGIRAFVNVEGVTEDLNDRLVNSPGWVLRKAADISNRGYITGLGTVNGRRAAFLLCPTDICPANPGRGP